MGNNNECNKDSFYMHIKLIGSNIDNFVNAFNQSEYLKNIKKFWDIDKINCFGNNFDQINAYFYELKQKREIDISENRRECLLLKIDNLLSKEVHIMLERMNDLEEVYFMPLVLLLTMDKSEQKLNIDSNKYDRIDPRLIFVDNYTENKEIFEEKIAPILVRFCSIHNELGDKFDLGIKGEADFDLIKEAFPFNMNIACIGRFGQGKSSGVNSITNEYKAKESNKGCSQTKNLTYYQIESRPIRILDIPGFESEESVKKALEKLKFCGKVINKIKDNIHIILYFLNYCETRAFMELEYPIIEEIIKHKSSKLIYVITHSKLNPDSNSKKRIINRINSGLYGITKNKPIKNEIGMLKADYNNVVFVNFYKDEENKIPPFGKYELFTKIHDFFIESETYKDSKKKLSEKELSDTIEKLKAEAKQILIPNKIWGAVVGIIPFADSLIQRFIINKNAIKKVGNLFGIDIKSIEEEKEKKKKELKKNKNLKTHGYITPEIDKENLIKADFNELNKESNSSKLKKIVKNTSQTTVMAKGTLDIYTNVKNSVDLWKEVENFEKLYGTIIAESGNLVIYDFPSFALENKYYQLIKKAASTVPTSSTASSFLGLGSMLVGVALGGYFTHQFCENLIDKFVDYYKKNANKIIFSYEKAISYFEITKDYEFTIKSNSSESLRKPGKFIFNFEILRKRFFFALIVLIISFYIFKHFNYYFPF